MAERLKALGLGPSVPADTTHRGFESPPRRHKGNREPDFNRLSYTRLANRCESPYSVFKSSFMVLLLRNAVNFQPADARS